MLSKVKSMILNGLEGQLIEIQTNISTGTSEFEIVGLPDTSVKEAKKRIEVAIKNSGFDFPNKKILINLAPANMKKGGSGYDLAMAIGILIATNKISKQYIEELSHTIFIGELSLDGKVNRINGILPMCMEAKDLGIKTIILSNANANEAAIVNGLNIIPIDNLTNLVKYLNKEIYIPKIKDQEQEYLFEEKYDMDFLEVKGQENIKRALEITVAGGHNCALIGSPGSGKTMMAKRLNTILPTLSLDEAMEITKIHSISGELKKDGLVTNRPFRMPHHTVTATTMIGGGRNPKPGEISLAHNGILFLDEFTEYNKNILECLREPLENKEITINRLNGHYTFPCNFMLVASMNPCPCGYYGDNEKPCKCSQAEIHRYLSKISEPLLDRIDIQVKVTRPKYEKLNYKFKSESSKQIRERVNLARKIQRERYKNLEIRTNAELSTKLIDKFCELDYQGKEILRKAFENLKLSVRAYEKVLKVSRTIADLENKEKIEGKHVAEAILYRSLEKEYDN